MKKIASLLVVTLVFQVEAESFTHHLSSGWYPSNRERLKYTLSEFDRTAARKKRQNGSVVALIAPHAGYQFSGTVAAAGYRLSDKNRITRVIILAPSHHHAFQGVTLPFFDEYQTPLGSLAVDTRCIKKLAKHQLFEVRTDVWSQEHSLEVQLPFLQYYLSPDVRIVPLIVGSNSLSQLERVAQELIPCIDEHTLVVVSSDFTHHGARFGYTPFERHIDIQKSIEKLDKKIIDHIMNKKAADVEHLLNKTRATVCGRTPIKLFKVLQEKGAWPQLEAQLVDYRTSHAVTNDPVNSVSYAAIVFTQKDKK